MDVGSCLLQQTASRTAGPAGGMPLSYRETVIGWRAQTTDEAQLIEAGIFVGTSSIQVRASGAKLSQIRPGTSAALHELSDCPARCTLHWRLVRRCQLVTLLSIGATVSVALCNMNGFSPLLSCEILSGNWIRGAVRSWLNFQCVAAQQSQWPPPAAFSSWAFGKSQFMGFP